MLLLIILYVISLTAIGIYDSFKVKSFDDYAAAGKNQGVIPVFLSLMATMLGASATLGMADQARTIGYASFWWLGTGAIGLMLQAFLLSNKIRALNATTLPDVAEKTVGRGARTILAFIISVSWVGIVAAQLVSMTKIISAMLPSLDRNILLFVISAVVILYTILGGQLSVIRSDIFHALIIFFGLIVTAVYLCSIDPVVSSSVFSNIQLTNEHFDIADLLSLLLITGGAYFLGPDIISRNLLSKNGKTAKKSALFGGITLLLFSAIITLISMWVIQSAPEAILDRTNPLVYVMTNRTPYPIAALLCIALTAALLSSADTCMINAASIIEHDILMRDNIQETRVWVLVIGTAALFIALFNNGIISILTAAYSIYVPGIVCPLFFAIWFHQKRAIYKPLWYMSIITGAVLGLIHSVFRIGNEILPLLGMGLSFILSGLSILFGKNISMEVSK